MNENLNLVDILKDCPKGTKFYSIIYGDVYFEYIEPSTPYPYPVTLKSSSGEKIAVTSKGQHYFYYNGECTLFPSRDQRDWSKWHRPFKDGDIILSQLEDKWVSIFKEYSNEKCRTYVDLNIEKNNYFDDTHCLCKISNIIEQRLATEEEKKCLFDAINEHKYRWNAEKKVLEKLIIPKFKVSDTIRTKNGLQTYEVTNVTSEYYSVRIPGCVGLLPVKDQDDYILIPNKFDPNTLIPFESKVLVRDSNHLSWRGSIYTHRDGNNFYTVNGTYYLQCIPYNEETKHLIGTCKIAPDYYRYWKIDYER